MNETTFSFKVQNSEFKIQLNPLALYIHFPYCLYKCHYCDFNSYVFHQPFEALETEYVEALCSEIQCVFSRFSKPLELSSIFLGGGTPSLFSAPSFRKIFEFLKQHTSFSPQIEITLEANPKTINPQKIEAYLLAGINRFSVGVQSFQEAYLAPLGRLHSGSEAFETLQMLQKIKPPSWSFDLMFAFPGQSLEELKQDLEKAMSLQPPHLSFYQLTLEPHTLMDESYKKGKFSLPEEALQLEMFEVGIEYLEKAGLKQYEISNFANPSHQSKHNLAYWNYQNYLGLGAGAVSFLRQDCFAESQSFSPENYGFRWMGPKSPKNYLAWAKKPNFLDISETIDLKTAQREWWMMGLRLTQGLDLNNFRKLFGEKNLERFLPILRENQLKGFLEHQSDQVFLTPKGKCLANEVIVSFL